MIMIERHIRHTPVHGRVQPMFASVGSRHHNMPGKKGYDTRSTQSVRRETSNDAAAWRRASRRP
eukprot:354503-Rhodomonas_salina.1